MLSKISVLIPCKNRTSDLKETLISIINAANESPPVEIVVLDYNSEDDLEDYIYFMKEMTYLEGGSSLVYKKYDKPKYYHMAHAYNLCFKISTGDYVVVLGADIRVSINYFKEIRKHVGADWMRGPKLLGILVCRRDIFESIGGYDERFEFYGPEDKDIEMRLNRLGASFAELPDGLISEIYTKDEDKLKNYHPSMAGLENSEKRRHAMKAIYEENKANHVIIVNKGKEWGAW